MASPASCDRTRLRTIVAAGYGLGLTEWHPAEFPGMELYGHGGGIAGFLTLVFHDPVKGITYFAAGTDLRLDFKPTMLEMVSYINGL